MPKLPTALPANAAAVVLTVTESRTKVEPIYPKLDLSAEGSQQDGVSSFRLTEIRTLERRLGREK